MGANVVGFSFLIELGFLKGAQKLNGAAMHAVLRY
jgi:adenine/guanine phosphoribosyltransferase-like PRPP-binding protein